MSRAESSVKNLRMSSLGKTVVHKISTSVPLSYEYEFGNFFFCASHSFLAPVPWHVQKEGARTARGVTTLSVSGASVAIRPLGLSRTHVFVSRGHILFFSGIFCYSCPRIGAQIETVVVWGSGAVDVVATAAERAAAACAVQFRFRFRDGDPAPPW